ncbi:hypothetical protein Tco_1194112 [Tanacetum coccineum]
MEAHLAPNQPIQVNKITSSCEICSGPHDSQYCMENPEQAFVDYASLRTDEAGDAKIAREVPSFDELEPQPNPLRNCPSLDVSLGEERGPEPPIKPNSPESFRMKVVDHLTIHTPPSPHATSFYPRDVYCYYHTYLDDPKKHYGFKPGLLGQSGSLGVDFSDLEVIENDFLGGLNLPMEPKELEKGIVVPILRLGRKAHLLGDKQIPSVGVFDEALRIAYRRWRRRQDYLRRRLDDQATASEECVTASGLEKGLEADSVEYLGVKRCLFCNVLSNVPVCGACVQQDCYRPLDMPLAMDTPVDSVAEFAYLGDAFFDNAVMEVRSESGTEIVVLNVTRRALDAYFPTIEPEAASLPLVGVGLSTSQPPPYTVEDGIGTHNPWKTVLGVTYLLEIYSSLLLLLFMDCNLLLPFCLNGCRNGQENVGDDDYERSVNWLGCSLAVIDLHVRLLPEPDSFTVSGYWQSTFDSVEHS